MCSWCWGFRNTFQQLLDRLPDTVEVRKLVGGLASDSDSPMPIAMQSKLQQTWQHIQQKIPGVEFNFDFWTTCSPRRSTYPACRAVIAATRQGNEFEDKMILGIQTAYYLQARNPSDISTLSAIANEIGLDQSRFETDIQSEPVENELHRQIKQCRDMHASSFPSLVLQTGGIYRSIPVDYNSADNMLNSINELTPTL
ncbi:MAG: DsbA family protein [Gammaproteobacteria bacterium]|nr:DsbA family protein [Gammaproteobacteria bacterium]